MICPNCKADYRHGVTRCPDCDVALVESLPKSDRDSREGLSDASFRVWSGEDQGECVSICARFKAAEIPYKVVQQRRQFLKGVDEHFKIGVPPQFSKQAKKIIEEGRLDFTDEAADRAIMELPEAGDNMAALQADRAPDGEKWDPRRAVVEIWSQVTHDHSKMIELSLRENDIYARTEVLGNGSRKLFVMPNDESRAREIVREIENGSPPR